MPELVGAWEESQLARADAEAGNAKAQVELGLMYADGRGVAQDYAEAYAWLGAAAAQPYGDAEEPQTFRQRRQELLDEMTPAQVERGKELEREYREKYVRR